MPSELTIARVAVPAPLSRSFDYILDLGNCAPDNPNDLVGCRVEVPFGRSSRVGIVLAIADKSAIDASKLKSIKQVLDDTPTLSSEMMTLLNWASRYYHCPIGEVVATALPAALRKAVLNSDVAKAAVTVHWQLTKPGEKLDPGTLRNARMQQRIITLLGERKKATRDDLIALGGSWRTAVARLCELGWVEALEQVPDTANASAADLGKQEPLPLNKPQQLALASLKQCTDQFQAFLLEGVTGSGKTEVYLHLSAAVVARRRQVLVIVPEIGLAPQLVARYESLFGRGVVMLHSGLNDNERLRNWRRAAEGSATIVVGTRSSVFVPLDALGLIIVDEEHDDSLKQQDGFRYHARDLALVRARDNNIPIVLGSATPSLETLHNARTKKYAHLKLGQRAGAAKPPQINLIDVRRAPLNEGLSGVMTDKIRAHLNDGNQVMLFINRRGYAPVMLCNACDAVVDCLRCDAHMTVHAASKRMRCHHCGSERPIPQQCGDCDGTELVMAGQGTERIEYALRALFPDNNIVRIDRDTTRRKGTLQTQLEKARSGVADILIGTQMLAKGHHFPGVTLVGLLDVDRGLHGVDFRAAEQLAQTIVQVAGRAGRAQKPGEVAIQTRHPDAPFFQTLIHQGYPAFAKSLIDERRVLGLPPFANLALLRAEAVNANLAKSFLADVKIQCQAWNCSGVNLLGPAAAPIERIAGRTRAQLLISTSERKALHPFLSKLRALLETQRESRKVRWSLDVDPADLM